MRQAYNSNNLRDTEKIAKKIVESINPQKNAVVFGLLGDLGGGKTSFAQGFAKALGVKEKVLSPTFIIYRKFKLKDKNLYHFDCYRVKNLKEILDLGFKDIVSNPDNIVLVEWADKIKKIMPKNTTWIKFDFIDENKRKLFVF